MLPPHSRRPASPQPSVFPQRRAPERRTLLPPLPGRLRPERWRNVPSSKRMCGGPGFVAERVVPKHWSKKNEAIAKGFPGGGAPVEISSSEMVERGLCREKMKMNSV